MNSAIAISALLTIAAAAQDTTHGKDILIAIADAYDENRASFGYGSTDFEYHDGYADQFDHARNGNLRDSYVANGTYVFNGQDGLYTKIFPTEAMTTTSAMQGSNRAYSRLDSYRILTNGKKTLTERIAYVPEISNVIKGYIIAAGPGDFFRYSEFPLDLGRPESLRDDLAQNIRMSLDVKAHVTVLAVEENIIIDKTKTVHIRLKLSNGDRSYWVDLERGAIPIRTLDEVVGGDRIERSNSKLTHFDGRGWLPTERTDYLKGGRVKRIVLKQTSFNQVPSRDAFKLTLDKPTSISDTAAGRYYSARTVYDLNNLPAPSSGESRPLGGAALSKTEFELPGEQEHKPRFYFTGAFVLSGVFCLVILWWRLRARR